MIGRIAKRAILFLGASFCILPIFANDGEVVGQTLSLEECLKKARVHYPLTKNMQLLNESYQLSLNRLYMTYIPHLKIASKVTTQSDVTSLPFNPVGIDYHGLSKNQYQVGLEISQPLLDGGNVWANAATQEAQTKVKQANLQNKIYKMQEAIINIYFTQLLLQEQIKQNDIHLIDLEKNYRNIEIMYQNGVAQREDIDKMQMEILSAKKNKKNLLHQKIAQQKMLSEYIGEDSSNYALIKPDSKESMEFLEQILHKANNPNNTIFHKRPEIEYFFAKEEEAESAKKLELSKSIPYIDIFAQGGYGNPGLNLLKSGATSYYIVGLRLNWDFTNLYSKIQQDEIIQRNKLQIHSQREEFLLHLRVALQKNIQSALSLSEQIADDEAIIALQTKIVQIGETKIKGGTLSVNDFISDINKLHLARLQKSYQDINLLMQIHIIKQLLNLWDK